MSDPQADADTLSLMAAELRRRAHVESEALVWYMHLDIALRLAVCARRLPRGLDWTRRILPDRLLSWMLLRWGTPTMDIDDGRRA